MKPLIVIETPSMRTPSGNDESRHDGFLKLLIAGIIEALSMKPPSGNYELRHDGFDSANFHCNPLNETANYH